MSSVCKLYVRGYVTFFLVVNLEIFSILAQNASIIQNTSQKYKNSLKQKLSETINSSRIERNMNYGALRL